MAAILRGLCTVTSQSSHTAMALSLRLSSMWLLCDADTNVGTRMSSTGMTRTPSRTKCKIAAKQNKMLGKIKSKRPRKTPSEILPTTGYCTKRGKVSRTPNSPNPLTLTLIGFSPPYRLQAPVLDDVLDPYDSLGGISLLRLHVRCSRSDARQRLRPRFGDSFDSCDRQGGCAARSG